MLDIDKILDKGLEPNCSLNDNEILVFALAYLESVADMEGWDHFFTYNMDLYPNAIKILKLAGDFESLKVLNDYKKHFIDLGIQFNPTDIDYFLASASPQYFDFSPDWRELFSDLSEKRWELISAYFKRNNIKIKT